MRNEYYLKDITRVLGIKRTALQQWLDRGYLAPSRGRADGHGSRNIWNRDDLFDLAVFKDLLAQGFSREEASSLIQGKQLFTVDPHTNRDGSEVHTISEYKGYVAFEGLARIGYAVYAARLVARDGAEQGVLFAIPVTQMSVFDGLHRLQKHLSLPDRFQQVSLVDVTAAIDTLIEKL